MRKRVRNIVSLAAVFTALAVMSAAAATGEESRIGPGWERSAEEEANAVSETESPQETKAAPLPARLTEETKAAPLPVWLTEDTTQLVVVRADAPDSGGCAVTYYRKEDEWKEIFSVRGDLGKAGVVSPEEKREGDKKTPLGVYTFLQAFGIKDDPGSVMTYRKIKAGDVWVDDSSSRHYNRLENASEVEKDWNSAENLIGMAPWYNYCLALSYNREQTPGKGSAIFLHAKLDSDLGTSGCIGIPEENVKQLLQSVDLNTKIVIISEKEIE